MEHKEIKHKNCERIYCPTCEGGLFACSICGCVEGATPDDCPGVQMTGWAIDEVYAGRLNFRDGQWRHEPSEIWKPVIEKRN